MSNKPNVIKAAIEETKVIRCKADTDWKNVSPRVELFASHVKGRVTLFLGSAISTFKPAQLPTWDKFIELLWTSLLNRATSTMQDREGRPRIYAVLLMVFTNESQALTQAFISYFTKSIASKAVQNPMITEIIARRLGKQYLYLLEAFAARKIQNGGWAVNDVHKWAAKCLTDGSAAAIMTTNFDDYLEKALEEIGAPHYKITGNPHVDGPEIEQRLTQRSESQKLILIVNGVNAFVFVRSLMPQLGGGKMAFLFKIHGSCYEPASCIDTRIQRAQGLPSHLTDVIDTLLQRSLWFVAGFSGSDMNDNLDYLRFVSNKRHSRVVWLSYPSGSMEDALHKLMETMDRSSGSAHGLAQLYGFFSGERTTGTDKFPSFDKKVKAWANSFGTEWCKLVIIDLMVFLQARTKEPADPALLTKLNKSSGVPRQDWNEVLRNMDLRDQESQVVIAKLCRESLELLQHVLELPVTGTQGDYAHLCGRMNSMLTNMNEQHVILQSATEIDGNGPHAQSWVLSCLGGLLLLCSGQNQAALRALDIASSTAWVVGDFDTHVLIERSIPILMPAGPTASSDTDTGDLVDIGKLSTYVAFISELDNVNAKINRFGIPPGHYTRALLSRSILFADGVAVPPNILTNSSVFISEILFPNDGEGYNSHILQHLYPLLPQSVQGDPEKLQTYMKRRQENYIHEPIYEGHIRKLDEYFTRPQNSDRVIYYDEKRISEKYGEGIRKLVDERHANLTVEHLVRMWSNIETDAWWNPSQEVREDRATVARECAWKLVDMVRQFVDCCTKSLTRSHLYHFADLFDEATDAETILKAVEGVSKETASTLLSFHEQIISKPWIYGPFCKELFDVPYKTNIAFDLASKSDNGAFVFLEQDSLSSWEFMATLSNDDARPVCFKTLGDFDNDVNMECSSLLLSQATDSVLVENRKRLAPVREKIASGSTLSEQDKILVGSVMEKFTQSSIHIEHSKAEKLAILTDERRACAKTLLNQCTFLVRYGQPLDRMYQESKLSVPGVVSLQRK